MQIAVIFNPVAGSGKKSHRAIRLINELRLQGHAVTVYRTQRPGDATLLAQQAISEGAETVVAVGGDGTVNEVIQGMVGSDVAMAVYPAGTTNVWCKQVKMPTDLRRAASVIADAPRQKIDLGRANERYFLLMTGIGLDGEITQAVNLQLKKKIGKAAYALAALSAGLRFRPVTANIVLHLNENDEAQEVHLKTGMIIVTNTERYAVMKLAREARLDDGKLDIIVFQEKNFLSRLRRAISLITSSSERDPNIERYRVSQASIEMEKSVGFQIDGDPIGKTERQPMAIECVPSALNMVIPQKAPAYLFTHKKAS